jgi:hypothetical protein
MEDGVTEESRGLFATTFTRMLYWSSLSYILLLVTDIVDRYFLLHGCQLFIMHFGRRGSVSSLTAMNR